MCILCSVGPKVWLLGGGLHHLQPGGVHNYRLVIVSLLFTYGVYLITTRNLHLVLVLGVRQQLDYPGQGFNTVFPLDKLGNFTPSVKIIPLGICFCQLWTLLWGNQDPLFICEEIMKYTKPKRTLDYCIESHELLRFVNVSVKMTLGTVLNQLGVLEPTISYWS